jgi:hypothetical protein
MHYINLIVGQTVKVGRPFPLAVRDALDVLTRR